MPGGLGGGRVLRPGVLGVAPAQLRAHGPVAALPEGGEVSGDGGGSAGGRQQVHQHGYARHPRGLGQPEQLLQLHREHRLAVLGGVVHPDPGSAGHLQAFRSQLVQSDGLAGGPGQQPVQGLPGVDPPEVGAAPGPGQLGLQPVVGPLQQGPVVGHVGPGAAERAVQEAEAGPEGQRVRGPAQQAEPLGAQPVEEGGPDERGVGGAQRTYGQFDRPQPLGGAGDEVAVLPMDLFPRGEQVRGGGPGGVLVDDGAEPDPGGRGMRGPVGDGDGQPGSAAQPRAVAELGRGAVGHEEGSLAPGFRHPLGEGQGRDQPGGAVVGNVSLAGV